MDDFEDDDGILTNHFWFKYNNMMFNCIFFRDVNDYTSWELKAVYTQVPIYFKASEEEAEMYDLPTVAHSIVETVRQGLFCEICGSICAVEPYENIDVGGVCTVCVKHYNEPGCKECGNPFGKLEEGLHERCAKRRRLE